MNLAVVASLLICVAMFVLWVRSFFATDSIQLGRWTLHEPEAVLRLVYLDSDRGTCVFTYRYQHDPLSGEQLAELRPQLPRVVVSYSSDPAPRYRDWTADDAIPLWNTLGFDYYDSNDLVPRKQNLFDRRLLIPHWFFVLIFGLVWALPWGRRRRQRSRAARNCCRACGYDLRATPDRCPECGAVAQATPGAAA